MWAMGLQVAVKAEADATGGAYSVVEYDVAPGDGSDVHTHTFEHEAWFMLDGTLKWRLDEQ